MDLIVDSCVIVSGLVPDDVNHRLAANFFAAVSERKDLLWAPATLLWDVEARFIHTEKARDGVVTVDDYDVSLQFMDVTLELFNSTYAALMMSDEASRSLRSSIRGGDHVFLSCALAKTAPLVTWDQKVRDQAGRFGVVVMTPDEYVARVPAGATRTVPKTVAMMHEVEVRFRKRSS